MRVSFVADVEVDRAGYVLADVSEPGVAPETIAGSATGFNGRALCEVSGKHSVQTYISSKGASLWKAAAKVDTEAKALAFFRRYGPVLPGRRLSVDSKRMFWPVDEVLKNFSDLRVVSSRKAAIIKNNNPTEFDNVDGYLNNRLMANNADIYLDKSGPQGITRIQLKSSYHFILIEMMHEIGVTRRTVESQRQCEHCGTAFTAGGGRGGSLRLDARYCTPNCAKAASRARRSRIVCSSQ